VFVPIISIIFGIIIRINFRDHNAPHLHAEYQGAEAIFNIRTGELMEGRLPKRHVAMIQEWMELNREALAENWQLAYSKRPTYRIPGLDEA
jgi:hypothetical protein